MSDTCSRMYAEQVTTRSARFAIHFSTPWMCDCGCLSTQPWWRPYSVACTVTSQGTRAARASRRAAPATSQSCECTRAKRSPSSRPAASMSAFMCSTQAMNASRSSLGKSGSRTRLTTTPWRSSSAPSRPPPRVSTWTSMPSRTNCSESLRTCRARPPSTTGGYSQDRISTRIRAAGTLPRGVALARRQHAPPRAARRAGQLVGEGLRVVLWLIAQAAPRRGGPPGSLVGRHAVDDLELQPLGGQAREHEPRRVGHAEPRREHPRVARALLERADAQAGHLHPELVVVEPPERLAVDLADAVERVRPNRLVADQPMVRVVEAGGVVGAGDHEPRGAAQPRRLVGVEAAGQVGRGDLGERRLGGDAAEVDDRLHAVSGGAQRVEIGQVGRPDRL